MYRGGVRAYAAALLAAAVVTVTLTASAEAAVSFELNTRHARPGEVSGHRMARIVTVSTRFWRRAGFHVRYAGPSPHKAGLHDGHNVISFARRTPRRSLGQTICRDASIHRHRSGLRHEHCSEVDIRLNPRAGWNDGPRRPSFDEFDLRTTLLHELGHLAGITHERRHCANSPMFSPLLNGEYWWGKRKSHRHFCGHS
jgi:hypothetical protein